MIFHWLLRRLIRTLLAPLGALGALCLALSLPAWAQGSDAAVARAVSVQGTVEAQRAGRADWQPVRLNDTFRPGDAIRVLARSRADIAMLDQSVMRLNANSTLQIQAPKPGKTGVVDLLRGAAHFFSRGPNSLEVNTPFTVAGVRGTEFLIQVQPDATLLTVFEGEVVAQNAAGSLVLTDGQSASARQGQAPAIRQVLRPRDAVHWTLHYPPVLQDPRAAAFQAQSLLAVGAVDEARQLLSQRLAAVAEDVDAMSLLAVVALVQGDREQALQMATRATTRQPRAASAQIALSYVQQARFDIPGALASATEAAEVEPANALAWARVAELRSASGDLGGSAAAAAQAAQLEPGLSRTQTVLGFSQLLAIRVDEARKSFERAIELDQADPLPRLGLGLARIRGGDLHAGSREIEVAASLDPANALVRSYLGKVYFEEMRSPRDAREFAVAKQLDPLDPTPWFYDAISKQTRNRPVEALGDLEQARALNDNRAVYRSRLLLDSDAAARAASQARVYADLGFQQRALVEGWLAVQRDPTNFSAHRFLADSYGSLPRHEIARVSELLQAQLLAPVTHAPLQPRQAESNLMLISSGGPGVASFNEFNPLFNRDGVNLLLGAMGGQQDTQASDLVVSGIFGRTSFSLGQGRFRTDGFRVNADQDDRIRNAFVQFDLTQDTSVQFEHRSRQTDWGDLQQRFLPNAFSTSLRNDLTSSTNRFGIRHAFAPGSVLIGSIIRQNRHTGATLSQAPDFGLGIPGVDAIVQTPEQARGTELQHLWRTERFSLRSGVGHFSVDRTEVVDQTLQFPLPTPPFPPGTTAPLVLPTAVTDARSTHINAYVYGNLKASPALDLTLGASYDTVDSIQAAGNLKQWNPKLGLVWTPVSGTTVRAAAFRALKRTLVANQTLEPTEVAGFNQFFDDANFTRSRRVGLAVDQRLSASVLAGAEASRRATVVPWTCANPACGVVGDRQANWNENVYRAYAFWTPDPRWALRAKYLLERFDRDADFTGGTARDLRSERLQFGARYFHPEGLGLSLAATHWAQRGDFGDNLVFQRGSERFWTLDAALHYRLPNRMGFLSLGGTNLLNRQFNYLDTDMASPTIQPRRMVHVQLTLVLP